MMNIIFFSWQYRQGWRIEDWSDWEFPSDLIYDSIKYHYNVIKLSNRLPYFVKLKIHLRPNVACVSECQVYSLQWMVVRGYKRHVSFGNWVSNRDGCCIQIFQINHHSRINRSHLLHRNHFSITFDTYVDVIDIFISTEIFVYTTRIRRNQHFQIIYIRILSMQDCQFLWTGFVIIV